MSTTELTELTDEQVLDKYNKLQEWFGDELANFEHHPKQFAYQVKLFDYYQSKAAQETTVEEPKEVNE